MFKPYTIFFSLILLILSLPPAVAQNDITNGVSAPALTITASASGERVRFTAPSSVVQIQLEVFDPSGKKLFDNELRGGNVLDWHMLNGQAEPLVDGSYLCVVTVKSLSGKIAQRIGSVVVEKGAASLQAISPPQMTSQQAEAVGPVEEDSALTVLKENEPQTTTVIAHNGDEGQIIRGKGALSFRLGDFLRAKDTEQMRLTAEGNLEVGGLIQARNGIVFPDGSIQFSAARKTFGQSSQGPGQSGKPGQEHFDTQSVTATQNFIAKFTDNLGTLGNSILFDNGSNIGISTTTPAKKLDVRGGQIALDNGRFLYSRRTNTQFQEAFGIDTNDDIVFNRNSIVAGVDADAPKAPSALIFGAGAGRFMDVRNSSNVTLMRVVEATGNVGIGTAAPTARLHVAGGEVLFENKWRTETTTVNPGPVAGPPNLIGGFLGTGSGGALPGNRVTAGVVGATIGGSGFNGSITFPSFGTTFTEDASNRVTDWFGTVGGGSGNRAGDDNAISDDSSWATVGGGSRNTARSLASTVGGGGGNIANGELSTIGGGDRNDAIGDYSTVGGGTQNFATGLVSTVGGGRINFADGENSTVGGGFNNRADGHNSVVPGGWRARALHYGEMAFASGSFEPLFESLGDAQTSFYTLRRRTTNATATELFLDGDSATARLTLADGRALTFDILVVGKTSAGNAAGYQLRGVIKKVGGALFLVGVNKLILAENDTSWDANVEADSANNALVIKVIGATFVETRWVATVRTVEVKF